MNVYDFDNTVYDGESSVDFFKFCLRYDKKLLRLAPLMIIKLIKYKLCLISTDELKRYVEKYSKEFIDDFDDFDNLLSSFWEEYFKKIKPFYLNQQKDDDILLTATFSFLIKIPVEKLGIKHVISSEIDTKTGELKRLCFREKKVELLKEYIAPGEKVCFYTDSMNDKSMIDFADEAYIVKGHKRKKIK